MAGLSISCLMLIVAIVLYSFLYPGTCARNEAKRKTTNPAPAMNYNSMRVDLIRRDSPISPLVDARNLSKAERLRRAIQRSHNRLLRFQHYTSQNASLESKLSSNSVSHRLGHSRSYYSPINAAEGEFLMQMEIGSPIPLNLHFILDTGSDLIWTQCQPCKDGRKSSCIAQDDPIYNPFQSSSFKNDSCSSVFCKAVRGHCDALSRCVDYFYGYEDLSATSGDMAYETFNLGTLRRASFPHLSFGCGHKQRGDFSHSAGVIGMGRGLLSLVSQVGDSIDNIFSYCLGSHSNVSQISPLFLGRAATFRAGFRATPLIPNTDFYYLDLRRISVDGKTVPIPNGTFQILANGSGGLIIDSGTTLTYLEDAGYSPFLDAVRSSIPVNTFNTSDYDLCYNATPALRLPTIAFHFAGGDKFVLPPGNAFISYEKDTGGLIEEDTGGLVCLAFGSAGPAGSTSVFGNIQQQNFHIAYDLAHNKLYFAPTDCASI